MTKIVRYGGNLQAFASAAPGTERTIFGDVAQANDLTSQINADFLRGWGIVGPSDQPALEDFNAVAYTLSQILAYLHQMGVAEYNSSQEYHAGSVTQLNGEIFVSLQNTNTGNDPASAPLFWRNADAERGVAGQTQNLRMIVSAASSSGTITANQISVGQSLTGRVYRLDSFSKVINLATVGAGGMDVGSPPANGWVAVYAIYNPVTGASALLAQTSPNAVMPLIYGGANMPAGFTSSALLTVLPTNGSGQFKICSVIGRDVFIQLATAFSGNASVIDNPVSIAAIVPANAVEILNGEISLQNTAQSAMSFTVKPDVGSVGQQNLTHLVSAGAAITANYSLLPLNVSQTVTFTSSSSAGTPTYSLYIGGYRI